MLELDELAKAAGVPTFSRKEAAMVLWEVDDDNDSALDWEEFRASFQRTRDDKTGCEPRKLFNLVEFVMHDKNGNGQIDQHECLTIMLARNSKVRAARARRDAPGGGAGATPRAEASDARVLTTTLRGAARPCAASARAVDCGREGVGVVPRGGGAERLLPPLHADAGGHRQGVDAADALVCALRARPLLVQGH